MRKWIAHPAEWQPPKEKGCIAWYGTDGGVVRCGRRIVQGGYCEEHRSEAAREAGMSQRATVGELLEHRATFAPTSGVYDVVGEDGESLYVGSTKRLGVVRRLERHIKDKASALGQWIRAGAGSSAWTVGLRSRQAIASEYAPGQVLTLRQAEELAQEREDPLLNRAKRRGKPTVPAPVQRQGDLLPADRPVAHDDTMPPERLTTTGRLK